ncbi:MAG: hypothetical protein AAFP90_16130, partial [Planctomycetota bacterium]
MNRSHSVPVLVSRVRDDFYMAKVLDGPDGESCAATSAAAFEQVRSHLKKVAKRDEENYWPTIQRYELRDTRVTVRLYYRKQGRQFPASRQLRLAVRYVLGHYPDKTVECFLPDYDVVFFCPAMHDLERLIEEQVRAAASIMDGRHIAAAAMVQHSEIRSVRVTPQPKERCVQRFPEDLTNVATPMYQKGRGGGIRKSDVQSSLGSYKAMFGEGNVLMIG